MRFLPNIFALLFLLTPSFLGAAGLEFTKYDDALKQAAAENKIVMVFFWTDWCPYCDQIKAEVLTKDNIKEAFDKSFIAVSIDLSNDPQAKELAEKYGATAVPTLSFISPKEELIAYWQGATDPETFLKILDHVQSEAQKAEKK